MQTQVQTELLPTDFALTETEKSQLSSRIQSFLNGASDEDLLSTNIVNRLKLLVEDVLEPWQMASTEVTTRKKPQELRIAAIESVPVFLNAATREQLDSLMKKFALFSRVELEVRLREDVAIWIHQMEDTDLLKYDSVSIQEPVFSRCRKLFKGRLA